jgi:NAD(P)-dependent dehydrogenase (short-subunit alcohol dehydrogenase family)
VSGRLADRTVLITGAAAGIGLATARRCLSEGARVVAVDVADGRELPSQVRFLRGNVRSAEDVRAAVRTAESWSGGLDAIVLNAGVTSPSPLLGADAAEIEHVIGVDLIAVILGACVALPALRRRGGGAIVVVGSLAGLIPYEPDPVYAAAKHGVVGFVRSIAPSLVDDQITVNAVCPGLTDTAILPDEVRAAAARERFALIPSAQIAEAILDCVTGAATGRALVCQLDQPAVSYGFRGVPGPAGGVRAPRLRPSLED